MTGSRDEDRRQTTYLLIAVLAAAGYLWISPLSSSLWLDETVTYWVVKDGLREAVDRALRYQQSPAYYAMLWLVVGLGGAREIVLRLPSVIAAAGAALLLYRLGTRLVDREAGLLAVTAFACVIGIGGVPANARPYATALMVAVAGTLALVRWLDRPSAGTAGAYVVLAALTVYAHYLFGIMLAVHVVYVIARRQQDGTPPWGRIGIVLAAIGVLLLPLGPPLLSLVRRRASLSWADEPSLADVLGVVALPLALAVPAWRESRGRRTSVDRASLLLVVAWSILPPLAVSLVTWLTSLRLFFPRYYLAWTPGLALLAGLVIRTVEGFPARRLIAIGLVVLTVAVSGPHLRSRQDWRSAVQAVRSATEGVDTPILVDAGLIESAQIDWLGDRERSSYLLAPLSFYPVRGRAIPIPYSLDVGAQGYLEALASVLRARERRFILIGNNDRLRPVPFREWFENRLRPDFDSWSLGPFGAISVVVFERRQR
jgi:4-amino-4-deoxy-L-arabinose transferase-like glycosyltransferase